MFVAKSCCPRQRYKMMVGAHNIVECQMHMGGCVVFFTYGRCRYLLYFCCREAYRGFFHVRLARSMPTPTTLSMPQRHMGEPYRICLVWELMTPTTLLGKYQHLQQCLGSVMSGRSQGTILLVYRVWSLSMKYGRQST